MNVENSVNGILNRLAHIVSRITANVRVSGGSLSKNE